MRIAVTIDENKTETEIKENACIQVLGYLKSTFDADAFHMLCMIAVVPFPITHTINTHPLS
jgi:hypothetical protein